jgi:hypothetical protein
MDRRMLAIGAAAIALFATACGDDATDRAIQAPAIGAATAEAADAPPNSGMIGEDVQVEGNARSDAAQGKGAQTKPSVQVEGNSRSDAAQR